MPSLRRDNQLVAFPDFVREGPLAVSVLMEKFSKEYTDYLNSSEWKTLRNATIELQGRVCQLTGISLTPRETHVHHWTYRTNLNDAQPADLSVLSESSHHVIHSWIKSSKVDRTSPDRLEKSRELYRAWLVHGKSKDKIFKRFKKWLRKRGVNAGGKRKLSRKKFSRKFKKLLVNRGRGFAPPRRKWLTISERERQYRAIEKAQGF